MQKLVVFLFALASLAVSARAAPAKVEAAEAEIESLLAESKDAKQLAGIEQETVKQLAGFVFNQTLRYLLTKLNKNPGLSELASQQKEEADRSLNSYFDYLTDEEIAEVEQSNLRQLLGSVLDSTNNYAQNRLSRGGKGGSGTFRGLLGRLLNGANNYAQNRLRKPNIQGSLSGVTFMPQEEKIARTEQETLRELGRTILKALTDYAQNRLTPDSSDEGELATEQQTLGDYLQRQWPAPSGGTDDDMAAIVRAMDKEEEVSEQAITALLGAAAKTLVPILLERFLSSNSGGGGSAPAPAPAPAPAQAPGPAFGSLGASPSNSFPPYLRWAGRK